MKLKDDFDNIRKLIKLNIESINSLIEQADNLKKVIGEINSSLDQESKNDLVEIRISLVKSINDLMEHTDNLFTSYNDVIEKITFYK